MARGLIFFLLLGYSTIEFFFLYLLKGINVYQYGGLGSFSHKSYWVISLNGGYICYISLCSINPLVTVSG